MIEIGIRLTGSALPIIIAKGIKAKNEIVIPFNTAGSFRVEVAIKRPLTTQNAKADRSASQLRFCKSMGMTSMIPAIIPK